MQNNELLCPVYVNYKLGNCEYWASKNEIVKNKFNEFTFYKYFNLQLQSYTIKDLKILRKKIF